MSRRLILVLLAAAVGAAGPQIALAAPPKGVDSIDKRIRQLKVGLDGVRVTVTGLDQITSVRKAQDVAEYALLNVLKRLEQEKRRNEPELRKAYQLLKSINPQSPALHPDGASRGDGAAAPPPPPFRLAKPKGLKLPPLRWTKLAPDPNGVMYLGESYVLGKFSPKLAGGKTQQDVLRTWVLPGRLDLKKHLGGTPYVFYRIVLEDGRIPRPGDYKRVYVVVYLVSPKGGMLQLSYGGAHCLINDQSETKFRPATTGSSLKLTAGRVYVLVFEQGGPLVVRLKGNLELWQGGGGYALRPPRK